MSSSEGVRTPLVRWPGGAGSTRPAAARATRRERCLEAADAVTRALLSGRPGGDVPALVAAHAGEITAAVLAAAAVPVADGTRLSVEWVLGHRAAVHRGLVLPVRGTLMGAAFAAGAPVTSGDMAHDARVTQDPARLAGLGPALAVPVGRAAGARPARGVVLLAREPGALRFSRREAELLAGFAARAAEAWELADLRQEAEQARLRKERDQIARDLHDLVIQRLFATGLVLQGAGHRRTPVRPEGHGTSDAGQATDPAPGPAPEPTAGSAQEVAAPKRTAGSAQETPGWGQPAARSAQQETASEGAADSAHEATGSKRTADSGRVPRAVGEIDETIAIIRSLIAGLRSPGRAPCPGLRTRVVRVADEAAGALGFAPVIRTAGPLDARVPRPVADHAVAVLSEALSNVARHARATRAEVTLETDGGTVLLTVSDDGRGIAPGGGAHGPGGRGAGRGLRNLAERAADLGGALEVASSPGDGTSLTWHVPLRHDGTRGTGTTVDG